MTCIGKSFFPVYALWLCHISVMEWCRMVIVQNILFVYLFYFLSLQSFVALPSCSSIFSSAVPLVTIANPQPLPNSCTQSLPSICNSFNVLLSSFFISQWTHLSRFAIDSTSKFHAESLWKLHRFWKANPRGNYDIDSTWTFRRGFDFQNRRNIDEFSTWIFLCRFDVEST